MEEITNLEYTTANYCSYCGDELAPERKETHGYDRVTGMPRYHYVKTCSNNFGDSLLHDYLVDYIHRFEDV